MAGPEDSRILDSICAKEEAECEEDSWIWEDFVGADLGNGDVLDLPKLKTIDVAQLLQVKFVYVSGGLDKTGSPLIIFPPSNDFSNINDTDIEKIFHYLVQRFGSEERQKGFTAIIDRRYDKWASVKLVLERLEVVIVNDIQNLYEYVDITQLTPYLGGTLNYEHQDWVQHRTAIDRFSESCRSIASRLVTLKQIFDKTDLSNSDIQEAQHVLEVHSQMWDDVRDDINTAQMSGNTQLKCIKGDSSNTESYTLLPILRSSVLDLQLLLNNLMAVRNRFEKFWEKYQTRVLQSLQFAFFEQECLQAKNLFTTAHAKLSDMIEVGDSISAAMKLKKDVEIFETGTKEARDKLTELCERGEEMIGNNHYCSQSIPKKCKELQNCKDELDAKLTERKNNLDRSVEVHELLQQVNTWCNTGVDILASQPLNRFQSPEGADKALKEIDEFLKKPQGVNLGKLNRMEKTTKELGDEHLQEQAKLVLKRISEVTEMMSNREASFRKMVTKRPVQPVAPVPPPCSPTIKSPITDSQKKKRESNSPLLGSHLNKDNKSPKILSPNPSRRPISIVVTPDPANVQFAFSDVPRSGSVSSPRNSNNIDDEDDVAILKKRAQVINELVETERIYVHDLQCVVEGYMKEYQDGSPELPRELCGKKAVIFGNINEIYNFHRDVFLRELELCVDQPLLVGEVFIAKEDEFQMYASYCKNKPSSEALRKECAHVPFFQECQKKLGHQLPLHAYLLKPIQRITKYQLILKHMIKYSHKSQECRESLEDALERMMKVLKNLNDVMHSTYIRGFLGSLGNQGKLLMQDSFVMWQPSKKLGMNLKHFKGRPRQVFLYEKLVVLTKREDETNKDCVYYQYKNSLKMVDIGLTETVKEDPLKFGLSIQNKSEFYTLQATSQDVKKLWVQEIRRLLQSQFSQVKESRSHSVIALSTGSESDLQLGLNNLSPKSLNNNRDSYKDVVSTSYNDDDDDGDDGDDDDDGDDGDDDDEWSDDSEWSEDEQITTATDEKESQVIYSAIADYSAFETSELSFVQNDLVQVLRIGNGGWWFARLQGTSKEGWVPGSYLEEVQHDLV